MHEPPTPARLRTLFLTVLFLRVRRHARIYFRHVKCRDRRADHVAEAVGLAWKWFVRLAERGKDATQFPAALATLAARAVRCGRRVCGQERARDALSPVAQQRRHFFVGKLPDFSTLGDNLLAEALHDNTRSEVPDQVCFRLDFPAWLATLGQRNRALVEDMALGYRTLELADRYRLSPSRISQMRRYFQHDWSRFCGDGAGGAAADGRP